MFNDSIDRCWFLTWTTYGSWLPGDQRGFVSDVRDTAHHKFIVNLPETMPLANISNLAGYADSQLKCRPIRLNQPQAQALHVQLLETAQHRSWTLFAVAIMATHVHVTIGGMGDPEPETLLGDLKRYGTRKLNATFGRPESGTWWTKSGSKRKLPNEQAVLNSIRYIRDQEFPLMLWTADLI